MKYFLFFALLTIPAAEGAPRPSSLEKTTASPPKARIVKKHPTAEKVFVSTSRSNSAAQAQSKRITKRDISAARKAVRSANTTANNWHFVPKFEAGGKADTTYGFLLKHRF